MLTMVRGRLWFIVAVVAIVLAAELLVPVLFGRPFTSSDERCFDELGDCR